MHYDLKTSSNEILLWAIDVIIMRKQQYMKFLDLVNSCEEVPKRSYLMERILHEEGTTLTDFDDEIAAIQRELDSESRYE